jgi:hypothetical protein
MKALSIMQPWAWLIVNGHKSIENRSWRCHIRGPILIHAGKKLDKDAASDLVDGIHPVTGCDIVNGRADDITAPAAWELGGIVGEAEIVDCITASDDEWFCGPFGIVLRNARPLLFRPCKGALGFFVPDWSVSPPTIDAPPRQAGLFP